MSNYDRYKFPSTLDAQAAQDRIILIGCPKEGIQQMRDELILDRRQARELRDLREVIKYFHGESMTERPVAPPPSAAFDYYFTSPELTQEVLAALLNITHCRDSGAIGLSPEGGVRLDPGHFYHDIPTPVCGGVEVGVYPRRGHKSEWASVLRLIEAKGAMSLDEYSEWKNQHKLAEEKFESIKRQAEDEVRRTNQSVNLERVKMFRFDDPRDVAPAVERLVRLGVPGGALQTEIAGLLLVKKNECENLWNQVEAALEIGGGKRVRGTDTLGEWLKHLDSPKIEFLFQDDSGAGGICEKLTEAGAETGTFMLEGGNHLVVNVEHIDKLKRMGQELKSAKASLMTKLGKYRL